MEYRWHQRHHSVEITYIYICMIYFQTSINHQTILFPLFTLKFHLMLLPFLITFFPFVVYLFPVAAFPALLLPNLPKSFSSSSPLHIFSLGFLFLSFLSHVFFLLPIFPRLITSPFLLFQVFVLPLAIVFSSKISSLAAFLFLFHFSSKHS